jgi:proteasome lid subunit RPN8/RPN11
LVDDRTPTCGSFQHRWEQLLADEPQRGRAALQDAYRHASEAYPDECCGFILASGQVHRAVNNQDVLHAEDPIRWPRSARNAYSLAPTDLYQLGLTFMGADPAIIVYHSHPDVGAYFSEKDAADALYEGKPIYDVDYLVIDVRQTVPKGAKLFRFIDSTFTCVWSEEL